MEKQVEHLRQYWQNHRGGRKMLMSKRQKAWMILFVILFLLIPVYGMAYTTGRVVDFFTGKPVKEAFVTLNNNVVVTDKNGIFTASTASSRLSVRAPGYGRIDHTIIPLNGTPQEIKLVPFTPKALYLSFFGIGDRSLRESA